MPNSRLPKQALYGQLREGKRTQGGQKKRYKDNLISHLRKCHFNLNNWEEMACDRNLWRRMIYEGTAQQEEDLHLEVGGGAFLYEILGLRQMRLRNVKARPKPRWRLGAPWGTGGPKQPLSSLMPRAGSAPQARERWKCDDGWRTPTRDLVSVLG
ncbi:hypothetical protein N1851_028675 [Merluccius polli]|uniref:Uncharacterized protein n=1 Tax=Merluccius polli TaxID=89951 RepID=A0AA47M864_MERPO|nr:hypothetical protein N1851_028675 [Merluccius polli]